MEQLFRPECQRIRPAGRQGAHGQVMDRLVGGAQVRQAMLDKAQGLRSPRGRAVWLAVAQQGRQEALGVQGWLHRQP